MKRIACLCVILLCAVSSAFAQKSKSKTAAGKKAAVSASFAQAEKAWKVFFPKFKDAVKNKDRAFIKSVMYKEFECWGWDACGDEVTVKPNESLFREWDDNEEYGWKDLSVSLSNGKFAAAEKDYRGIYTKSIHTESDKSISFEFHRGSWWFSGFRFVEGA
ncbi:MAG: hypothetical protein M3384_17900 [Acidobacteriota bacterium]|nr:hypothetical protein [Acidobacteriota bacterium]